MNLVLGAGFTFDNFQAWGMDTGNVDGADSLESFESISTENAERLLRNPKGLIAQLFKFKEPTGELIEA